MAIPSRSLGELAPAPVDRPRRWPLWLLAVSLAVYSLSFAMEWDDRGMLWVSERFQPQAKRDASVWLPDYHVVIDAKPLVGMEEDETSDLTYNPATRTLFTVTGKNASLAELTLDGEVLRQIPLNGWSNPEGVAALDNGRLVIVDERKHLATIVTVDANTRELNLADFPQYDLGKAKNQNKAFEGVAWDAPRKQLLFGEERPPALYRWKLDGNGHPKGSKERMHIDDLDLRNLSALAIDPRTQHLLMLSAQSHMLLEFDGKGQQTSFMTLLAGFNGLKETIPRAEGVALDEDGTIYVVSEPNLFYSFKKQ